MRLNIPVAVVEVHPHRRRLCIVKAFKKIAHRKLKKQNRIETHDIVRRVVLAFFFLLNELEIGYESVSLEEDSV